VIGWIENKIESLLSRVEASRVENEKTECIETVENVLDSVESVLKKPEVLKIHSKTRA